MTISALLSSRALIRLRGPTTHNILQGVITNDINNLPKNKILYSHILNKSGRVQTDVMLYEEENSSVLVEVDQSLAKRLVIFFNRYNLNKDCKISVAENLKIGFSDVSGQFIDPRVENFGFRSIIRVLV